jgi:hypothetical protein
MPDLLEIIHREWPVIRQAPYSFFISVLVMASLMYALFEWRYRKRIEKREESMVKNGSSASISGSGNSNSNAIGNKLDVHLGPAPLPPPPKEPDDPPVINFEEARNIFIANSGWVWVEHHEGLPALVAVFRNRIRGVGIPTPIAYRVSAHLTFRSANHTVSIDHGAWLGEYTYLTDFQPNDVRKLVVVLHDQHNLFCTMRNYCSSDPRKQRFRSGGNIRRPAHIPLNDDEWEVEIVLVESDTALFSRKFWLRTGSAGGWLLLP